MDYTQMQNKSGRRSSYRILKIICLSLMFLLSVFLFTGTVRARESGGEYVQKRYRNSEYGYDLKFPSDWELCEDLSPVYSYMSYPPYHRMCIQTRQAGFGAAELYKITVDVLGKISGMLISNSKLSIKFLLFEDGMSQAWISIHIVH